MDETGPGCGGYGEGPSDQFHRNEAIFAVADEGFVGEEKHDYEDLNKDVNVGENFQQSLPKNDDNLGQRNERAPENNATLIPPVVENTSIALQDGIHGNQETVQHQQPCAANMGSLENVGVTGNENDGVGGTTVFVGELLWWTTDAELKSEASRYGRIKEVKFFEERSSGRPKCWCPVEFNDPAAATACKEGMHGHIFNGRPCVVQYDSPNTTAERTDEAQAQMAQTVNHPPNPDGVGSSIGTGGNHQGRGDNSGREFGRGKWRRRTSQGGTGNRRPIRQQRGRAGRSTGNDNEYGQGIGATPPLLHPQTMWGQGFYPAPAYGGFVGVPTGPYSRIFTGVAAHVNPAFLGMAMPVGGMGMMPTPGVGLPSMAMWPWDPNMGQWIAAEEHGERAGGRRPLPDAVQERDRGSEREWPSSSERRRRDDREAGYDHRDHPRGRDLDRARDDRDRLEQDRDHQRDRNREAEYGESSSRRSRSRDADHGKRRGSD